MDRPTQRAIPIELQKYGEMLVKRKPRYFQSIKAAAAGAMVCGSWLHPAVRRPVRLPQVLWRRS